MKFPRSIYPALNLPKTNRVEAKCENLIPAVPDSQLLMHATGFVGFVIAVFLTIILFLRKDASSVAKTYAIGSAATFHFGGFTYGYFWILLCECTVSWTHPFGLIGGYALMVVALVQYWFDRRKLSAKTETQIPSAEL
ncbi:MAG: hypothetical protein ACFFDV_10755 [Candidatus Thorarchaeota archaeon]